MPGGGGGPLPATATVGRNPANGVVVYYALKAKPTTDLVLEFLDADGKSIRKFTASAKPSPSPGQAAAPAGLQRRRRGRLLAAARRRELPIEVGTQSICLGHALSGRGALSGNDSVGRGNSWAAHCAGKLSGEADG